MCYSILAECEGSRARLKDGSSASVERPRRGHASWPPGRLPLLRFASVNAADPTFLCLELTWHDLFPFGCVSSTNQIPETAGSGEPVSLEHHLFGQARPVRRFISLKLPGQRAFLRNSFFQRFFFLPLPTFCLRENEMSIFCFLIFFQESKGLLTSSLSPPFLPSSRRYSSEKKRTKYCSCSLS